jgi:protein-disulfide isomerase/rhodanese-related sulfurtransferase
MRKLSSLALGLLGLFDSLYLLWVYTSPSRPMVCLGTGCDVVRASAYSHLWGMPVPVYGVVAYTSLVLLLLATTLAHPRLVPSLEYLVAGISGVGFLFSLYLTYLQGFVIHAWCAWCDVSALAITGIFALAVANQLSPRRPPEFEPADTLAQARAEFAVCVAAILVGVPAFLWLMRHGVLPPLPQPAAQTLLERLVRPDSRFAGDPQAPVTVVEFGDFECPMCGQVEEAARQVRAKYGTRIRYVFREFPVTAIHPQAEKAAEAAECAAEQGKFWEAVEKFYAGQEDLSEPALERYAAELGLDTKRFHQCLASGAQAARVRRDLDDGHALGVRGTPIFVIGRQMIEGPLQFTQFSQLIDQELAAQGVQTAKAPEPAAEFPKAPQKKAVHAPTDSGTKPARPSAPSGRLAGQPAAAPASTGSLGAPAGGFFTKYQTSDLGCSEDEANQKQPSLIGTTQARQLFESLTKPKPLFVDVRSSQDYSSGRIPGAINLPLDIFEQDWSRLPKDRTIVLYESGLSSRDICAASRAAGRALLAHGFPFEQVKVYQDGLAGWEKMGLPTER